MTTKHETLPEEKLREWCCSESPKVVEILKSCIDRLFPGISFRLATEDDGCVITLDGYFLCPVAVPVKRIGSTAEFPGWELGTTVTIPGGYHEPDDYDYTPISQHRNSWDAARELITAALAGRIRGWFESEGIIRENQKNARLG